MVLDRLNPYHMTQLIAIGSTYSGGTASGLVICTDNLCAAP